MSFRQALSRQFLHPTGVAGALAGKAMARKNRVRVRQVVHKIAAQASDRILEFGHGPGVALKELLDQLPDCDILGLDHSAVMHGQAQRRNRAAIAAGRLTLRQMRVEDYSGQDGPFDVIFSINTLPFVTDASQQVKTQANWLAKDGRYVIVHQPPLSALPDHDLESRKSEFESWPAQPNPVLYIEGTRTDR